MKKKIYTLNVRQTGQYQYEVTVPEIGAMKTAATLDSALNITLHDILMHLTTRYLILVFTDQAHRYHTQYLRKDLCSSIHMGMIVIDARMFSSKHVMISNRDFERLC